MASPKLSVEQVTVTPKRAAEWLELNVRNYRRLRASVVAKYAEDMRSNAWSLTGGAISFDTEGMLVDGQHRLAACVKAETPFKTLVVWGVTPESILNIDTGLRRTLNDHLRHLGEPYSGLLAATISVAWRYEKGISEAGATPTFHEAIEWLDANPDVRESVAQANGVYQIAGIPAAPLATVAYFGYFSGATPEDVDQFMEEVKTGENLSKGMATYALRQYFLNRTKRSGNAHFVNDKHIRLAVLIKAWNAYITGTPVQILKWRSGGAHKEAFPRICGPDGKVDAWRD